MVGQGGSNRATASRSSEGELITGSLRVLAQKLLVILVVVVAVSCDEPGTRVDSSVLPDQVIEDFRLDETSSGERLFSLEAGRAEVREDSQIVELKSVRVLFYDDTGGVYSVLTAREGTIWRLTENLVARGGVEVRTADSTILVSESLVWSNGPRRVHTDAPVAVRTPRGEVRGVGLESDAGLERIQMKSEVRGTSNWRFEE